MNILYLLSPTILSGTFISSLMTFPNCDPGPPMPWIPAAAAAATLAATAAACAAAKATGDVANLFLSGSKYINKYTIQYLCFLGIHSI